MHTYSHYESCYLFCCMYVDGQQQQQRPLRRPSACAYVYLSCFYPCKLFAAVFCAAGVIFTAVARFLAIAFVIIPGLACIFVLLGILFHIPQILAIYVCCALINICWWHLGSCSSLMHNHNNTQGSLLLLRRQCRLLKCSFHFHI